MTKQHVTFTVGGESVDVPPINWDVLEDTVLPILDEASAVTAAGVVRPWYNALGKDVAILAAAMRRPLGEVRSKLSLDEAKAIGPKMLELLRISGFNVPGEAQAASGSTETLTDSSPSSSPEDSLT